MFYQLIENLKAHWDFPGIGLFQYLSFRSILSVITGLLIATVFGRKIIRILQRHYICEEIRDLGVEGQLSKKGTPTMGGLIIILAILVPVLLFCDLSNIYVILLIITCVWLGLMGFLDDYLKLRRKNKDGLKGRFKLIGQFGLGLIVALCLCFGDQVMIGESVHGDKASATENLNETSVQAGHLHKSTVTTIPFVKNNEFDYAWLSPIKGKYHQAGGWAIYLLMAIFIVMAVSNGANLTDGMDGMVTGISVIVMITLGIFAYLSGNIKFSDYLNIMYIPRSGEITVFLSAAVGALIGFLWYNAYPAQIFMGDTGSLTMGGLIAVAALITRKELLLPLLCGIFLIESLSVILQTCYFKYTKRKYGVGKRIFKMSPLHHHFQKDAGEVDACIRKPYKGIPEAKIVIRFWIVCTLLAALSIITLKIR